MKRTKTRPRFHPLVWLVAACFVCYGAHHITQLGLYHDDWAVFVHMFFAEDGFLGAIKALAKGEPKQWFRPLSLPIWALQFTLFGVKPLGWHLVSLAANAWIAWGLFRLARLYGAGEAAALA